MSRTRRARLKALAKINLDLRVLGPRPDGYHELRTLFQTISLADEIEIAFTPAPATEIVVDDDPPIPDNLAERAARLVLDAMRITGRVDISLRKRIPMGAGLGGGSSDAAAVLLALPVLAGGHPDIGTLSALGQQLGSDVPFFLLGGAAVGIGRGTELFPLPDLALRHALLVAPEVHVPTAAAYRALAPRLTTESQQNKIFSFQTHAWMGGGTCLHNDFEAVVFEQYPELAALKNKLIGLGASAAMMTGSGSAIFAFFGDRGSVARAQRSMADQRSWRISLVPRSRYRSLWWRALDEHMNGKLWPPQSRYM